MRLTDLHIRHFHDTGYLLVPHAVPVALCERLIAFIRQETRRENPPAGKLHRFHDRAPALVRDVIAGPALVGALTRLLGPNVVCVTNRHNHAGLNPPGAAIVRYHRDILQPTRGLVTAILYLQESTSPTAAHT
ncbi:hypothetical protein [Actinomadura vinacea]|uniref:hypothetical protein n=1 Tax=Actinomadura vinacea TaxID=115336 RepID=UPI0031D501B8